ncbi:hypothetical protein C9374_010447 [Naegleria lovaniensis]|uniref:Guanine nucleotide-binding protein subunit beta-like protein n=1 Tax=Naegleria lovaniensis TaxID=51637 RepID=A0AA88KE51_NAELO|nr:uncharacterized protein C9374_010447 [Naegleria lovaniensis]KAG2374703.1 hypothetical protein C9374_010447 [Naegleria lovaniensis]
MQQHAWQQPYVNIVKLCSEKSKQYSSEGGVSQEMDRDIGKTVFRIKGSVPSNNYVSFPSNIPKNKGDVLGLVGQFCYVQLRASKEVFVFHIDIMTKDEMTIRFSFGNVYKQVKKTHNTVYIPVDYLNDKWTTIAIDFKALVQTHLEKVFKCVRGAVICANLSLKNIFTSDNLYTSENLAKDLYLPIHKGMNWSDEYDWFWIPGEPANVKLACIIDPDTLKKPSTSFNTSRTSSVGSTGSKRSSKIAGVLSNKSMLTPSPIMECKRFIGYNSHFNSNLCWTLDSAYCLFPCGSTIIKMDVNSGKQTAFQGHTHFVTSLATDFKCSIMASVQNTIPLIRIWDVETCRCLAVLKGQESEITCLCISDNGNVLMTIGKDKSLKTQFIIWDISNVKNSEEIPIISKYVCDYSVKKVSFAPGEDTKFVTCGFENIRLWRLKGGIVRGCSLSLENYSLTKQNFLDIAFEKTFVSPHLGDKDHRFYLGTESGAIYQVNYTKRIVECVFQLHNSAINSLYINEGICITGSSDKYVRVWPLDFSDFFIEAELENAVMSVVTSKDGFKALIGDSNGSIGILEISSQKYRSVLRSHTKQVLDVASDPNRMEFATVALDRTIRIWDLTTLNQKYQFDVDGENPICVDYHKFDHMMACGFESGIVRIFEVPTTQVLEEYKAHLTDVLAIAYTHDSRWLITSSKESICVSDTRHMYQPVKVIPYACECKNVNLSMSRDGKYFSFISPTRNLIHVYGCNDFEEVFQFETPTDFFESIVFSADSKEIIASTSDSKLMSICLEKGEIISETEYAPKHNAITMDTSQNGKYLVCGGEERLLRVWNSKDLANFSCQKFVGHSGNIKKVIFTSDCGHVISCGEDGILVWTFLGDKSRDINLMIESHLERRMMEKKKEEEFEIDELAAQYRGVYEKTYDDRNKRALEELEAIDPAIVRDVSANQSHDYHDHHHLVHTDRPFKKYMFNRKPSKLINSDRNLPREPSKLTLARVCGYSSHARENLIWLEKQGSLIYTSGNVIIIEDIATRAQQYLTGHEHEINMICIHPNNKILASCGGAKGITLDSPIIFWNLETKSPVKRLEYHKWGVLAMDFSHDGKYFISVGINEYDDKCVLAIWSVETGKLIANTLVAEEIYVIKWFPSSPSFEFITCGKNSITFWYLNPEGQLLMSPAKVDKQLLGSPEDPIHFTSIGFSEDYRSAWIGASSGFILAFNLETNELDHKWMAVHDSYEIDHICWRKNTIITSGTDGSVKRWKCTKKDKQYHIVLREQMELDGPIIASCFDEKANQGVVGTCKGTIWYIHWDQQQCIRMITSHSHVVSGLAKVNGYVTSSSHDGTVRVWTKFISNNNLSLNQVLEMKRGEDVHVAALCMDKSSTSNLVVVGYSEGTIFVNYLNNLENVLKNKIKPHEEALTCILVTPSNRIITGSANGILTLVDNLVNLTSDSTLALPTEFLENRFIFLREFQGLRICSLDYDPKTKRFVNTTCTGLVSVWNDTDLTQIAKFAPHIYTRKVAEKEKYEIDVIAKFSPFESEVLLITAPSKTCPKIEFYNYKREYCLRVVEMHCFANCFAISQKHRWIAFGTRERLVVLMNYSTGEFEEYEGHGDGIQSIMFDDECDELYSAGFSDTFVWKLSHTTNTSIMQVTPSNK